MANTYTPISSQTLTTDTQTINLSGFSGYTDLRIVFRIYVNSGLSNMIMRFNNDTTSKYSQGWIGVYGPAGSPTFTNGTYGLQGFNYIQATYAPKSNTIPALAIFDIPYITGAPGYLTYMSSYNAVQGGSSSNTFVEESLLNQWKGGDVTSIQISTDGAMRYVAGTTVEVYGLVRA
jgi:hypothetical protein